MYLIINNTTRHTETIEGSWPSEYLGSLMKQGQDILVISMYSRTIKVLELHECQYGIDKPSAYSKSEYKLPLELINKYSEMYEQGTIF